MRVLGAELEPDVLDGLGWDATILIFTITDVNSPDDLDSVPEGFMHGSST